MFEKSEYILIKADSINGNMGTQYFVYKYDTNRKMQVDYWGDGKIMAKSFSYRGNPDGKRDMYDFDGTVMAADSFSNGVKLFSKKYYTPDASVKMFKDGKLDKFISIDSLK